jgi:hypothetical protein
VKRILPNATFLVFLSLPLASEAATAGLGSWFKRNIADPITDASKTIYRVTSDGVESVVDATTGAVKYVTEKTTDGVKYVVRSTTETAKDIYEETTDGLVYVGKRIWDGMKWIPSPFPVIDAKRWGEAQFKSNTEGTMTYSMPIALTRDGTDYLATQIFGLVDFKTAKANFSSFDFKQAYMDFPSSMSSGKITWSIECYTNTDCSPFTILSDFSFTPGSRLSSNDAVWISQINSMLSRDVKEALMVFRITSYGSSPQYVEMKYGFGAGMKGVK